MHIFLELFVPSFYSNEDTSVFTFLQPIYDKMSRKKRIGLKFKKRISFLVQNPDGP